jgi:general nucleoside transport system permease protein
MVVPHQKPGGACLARGGENHAAAHALGYPVRRIRLLAILFGGGCAGLAGAYMSLLYTPFWTSGMTGGRGWISLAIVVFASWVPFRAMVGAYLFGALTILQLYAQSAGVPLPSQFLAALPYLLTIFVLVLIMRARQGGAGRRGLPALERPLCRIGKVFRLLFDRIFLVAKCCNLA